MAPTNVVGWGYVAMNGDAMSIEREEREINVREDTTRWFTISSDVLYHTQSTQDTGQYNYLSEFSCQHSQVFHNFGVFSLCLGIELCTSSHKI